MLRLFSCHTGPIDHIAVAFKGVKQHVLASSSGFTVQLHSVQHLTL